MVRRKRLAIARMTWRANSGVRWTRARKCSRLTGASRQSVRAMAEALRGLSSIKRQFAQNAARTHRFENPRAQHDIDLAFGHDVQAIAGLALAENRLARREGLVFFDLTKKILVFHGRYSWPPRDARCRERGNETLIAWQVGLLVR